ncbi:inner membrane CreD family protein, partial [bacterium]|nr:inner membrane CreD family protein [bacterium]
QTSRSIRYSALVIIFTMLAFFFAERLTRCRVHPVQYLMAGLAVVLFYVLLLSLGEHIPFAMAYGAAALVVSAALGYYSRLIFRRSKPAIVEFIAMLAAYGAVFVMLQLETYALLTGSAALFILLLVLMTLTGNLNRREAEK